MNAIKEFVAYPFVVFRCAVATWWSIFREHWGWSALIGVAAFATSAALHQELIGRWPALKELLGDPMGAIASYLVYGLLGLGCVSAVTLLGSLIAAPSQIYREQKNKIASLMPPPLNLTLAVGTAHISANRIDLDDLTLTNHSQKRMELTFSMRTKDSTEIAGAWHVAGRSTQDGQPRATINVESTLLGALVFKVQDNLANVSLDSDCVLEISDAISRATVFCKPKQGYPNGKVAKHS